MDVIAPAAGAVAAAGAFAAWAVRGKSSSILAPSDWRGAPASPPSIALTFDDGPSESTPALLEILAANGVPATFFQCGVNVRRLPRIARDVAAAGHELGNHTNTHRRLDFQAPAFIEREIAAAQQIIEEAAGVRPRLFRAPYGVRWFGLRDAQQRHGLQGVMWTVIGADWRLPGNAVSARVVRRASNGGIVCLHDGRILQTAPNIGSTLAAVRSAIPLLKDRGYRFVTVSELLCLKPPPAPAPLPTA